MNVSYACYIQLVSFETLEESVLIRNPTVYPSSFQERMLIMIDVYPTIGMTQLYFLKKVKRPLF